MGFSLWQQLLLLLLGLVRATALIGAGGRRVVSVLGGGPGTAGLPPGCRGRESGSGGGCGVAGPGTAGCSRWRLPALLDDVAAVNAERLAQREERELGRSVGPIGPMTKVSAATAGSKAQAVGRLLELDGCLSVGGVLSDATCISLLRFINEENERSEDRCDDGYPAELLFGGVNCRGDRNKKYGQRRDLFLPVSSPVVKAALSEALTNLRPLLSRVVGESAMLHEISSIISYPGSPRQCVHADTIVLPCPQYPNASMEPLYTFFVALQDVEEGMGHTQYVPKTHTAAAHQLWNQCEKSERNKIMFLNGQKAVESKLSRGDCAVFDSRVLHCGRENSSDKVRVLFYFTLSRQHDWPLPDGLHGSNSVRVEDRFRHTLDSLLLQQQ